MMTVAMILLLFPDPHQWKENGKRERKKPRHCTRDNFTERTHKSDFTLLRGALSMEKNKSGIKIRRSSDKRRNRRARTGTTRECNHEF